MLSEPAERAQGTEEPAAVVVACEEGRYWSAASRAAQPGRGHRSTAPRRLPLPGAGSPGIRPFCDGTHKVIGFRAPSGRRARAPGGRARRPGRGGRRTGRRRGPGRRRASQAHTARSSQPQRRPQRRVGREHRAPAGPPPPGLGQRDHRRPPPVSQPAGRPAPRAAPAAAARRRTARQPPAGWARSS